MILEIKSVKASVILSSGNNADTLAENCTGYLNLAIETNALRRGTKETGKKNDDSGISPTFPINFMDFLKSKENAEVLGLTNPPQALAIPSVAFEPRFRGSFR